MGNKTNYSLSDLVEWYAHMGVNAIVQDEPRNLMVPLPKEITSSSLNVNVIETAATPGASAAALDPMGTARSLAQAAQTLDDLKKAMQDFEGSPLRATATQLVFEDGNRDARIMLIGEAPGRDEDLQGKPFVGRAGKLLDLMLASIGLDRGSVYIANVVPWRPPGNKTPGTQDVAVCLPFIRRQIALKDPDVLLLLGGVSGKAILDTPTGIMKLRGTWSDYDTGERSIKALATLHPAYLLRQPLQKKLAWADLLAFRAHLTAQGII